MLLEDDVVVLAVEELAADVAPVVPVAAVVEPVLSVLVMPNWASADAIAATSGLVLLVESVADVEVEDESVSDELACDLP